jgi:protein-L-isoaspartate(D-aspartate) O-methyltransferase
VERPEIAMSGKETVVSAGLAQFEEVRWAMVEEQIRRRGIVDEAVLRAMRSVPRHEFVPVELTSRAYEDVPLPIGGGQTISQPYIVADMTAALELRGNEKVLEIGTGCGYQAAVLGCVSREVHSMELREDLARAAGDRLSRLGYVNVRVHCGDGTLGLPEFAPYDAILVAAAAPNVPKPLLEQLAAGGRMIAPVGEEDEQTLVYVKRRGNDLTFERRETCRFVPLLGRYGWRLV